ncbi:lipopolysaccharide biosynthesis protein [Hirschia baltica]|uniref:Polysaccharide biosynthesis protein n=1 Tax=Hirschia baltica (strain ATCC 49814 / DSM 5838 / IFAM 1418) TaxID=582402 RepID=C6XLZ3_HIRBI|nr:lipopolysaccharide biosynthesis protein [Hirschia baltica]ACT59825.1 polysaccharide biosynthesis protein [Hirschia baltica ATCC 49814]
MSKSHILSESEEKPSSPENDISKSMGSTVVKGAAWGTLATIARISSALLVLPVLARYLLPEEFGIVQIGMPVVLFLMLFNDFGFGPALVRAKSVTNNAWSSVFWVNISIGILMTITMYAMSGPIANWYKVPEAKPILEALSLILVLSCVTITPAAMLQRKMRFDILSMTEVISIGAGICVAFYGAINGYGAWALVGQQVTMFALKAVFMLALSFPPVSFVIDRGELKSLLGFSSHMMASRVLNFFSRNIDNIVIGRVLGAAALGYYSIAYRILLLPVEVFAWGLSQVLMPAMSKFQDDKGRMRAATLRTYRLISVFTFPLMAGISILAEPIIVFFLGERMANAAIVLQIIAPVGAIQSITSTQGAMYMALGRADILSKLSLLGLIAMTISTLIGAQWGLVGISWAYLILVVVMTPLTFLPLFKLLEMPISTAFNAIKTPLISTLIMTAILVAIHLQTPVGNVSNFVKLLILVPIGGIIYIASAAILDRPIVKEVFGLVDEIRKK